MRAIWKGAISFGLVNVPIGLYAATRTDDLTFHMLRRQDLSRIQHKRVAAADHQEVPWEDVVKGYEYEKGKHVIMHEEDFLRVDVAAAQTVHILDFVNQDEVNPIFFQKPFYMAPEKGGEKAYALLRQVLEEHGVIGISKVVLRTRQHLAAVKAQDGVLILELMHFQAELVDPRELHIPSHVRLGTREVDMAARLVERMTARWDPERYSDDYRAGLMKVIEAKVAAGGELPPLSKARKARKVDQLVDVLRESLEGGRPAKRAEPLRLAARRSKKKAARKSR